MKKMLLISAVASAVAFAGGDIAPVQPVQPTPAAPAACNFWGTIGARYDAIKDSSSADTWGSRDNKFATTVVMGVEKNVANLGGLDIGLGAEVAAWSILGMNNAASASAVKSTKLDDGELSQLYLTAKYNNTAFKIGRQALPKSLSPWAWSDRSVGVLDRAFNSVVVVNTDLPNTTLVGAWVHSFADNNRNVRLAGNKGLFMLAAQYKGIANTTLTGSLYYIPKDGANKSAVSAWASAEGKVSNVDLGLQVAYAKAKTGNVAHSGTGEKATTGVAAYVGTSYEGLNAKLTLAYLKSGNAILNLGGTSAFWGNSFAGAFGGDIADLDSKQKLVRLDVDYKIANYGTIYGGVAYDKFSSSTTDKKVGGRVGYEFNVAGIDAKVEYRYVKTTPKTGAATKQQRVRVEGIYKF